MARHILTTYYLGAHSPTVLVFESKAEAEAFAARVIATYTGVSRVEIREVAEDEEQDNLSGASSFSAAAHMAGAVVLSSLFIARLIEVAL